MSGQLPWDYCEACPFPDQTAALELVRLREGIGRLASEWAEADALGIEAGYAGCADKLRALLDDNQGER